MFWSFIHDPFYDWFHCLHILHFAETLLCYWILELHLSLASTNRASLNMSRHLSSYFPVLLSINPGQDLASQIVSLRFYRSYQIACQGCWCVAVPSTMSECSNVPPPLFFWLPMAFQRQTCGQVWSGPEVLICTSLMTSVALIALTCYQPAAHIL